MKKLNKKMRFSENYEKDDYQMSIEEFVVEIETLLAHRNIQTEAREGSIGDNIDGLLGNHQKEI